MFPLLAVLEGHGGRRHDGALSDVGASVLQWLTGRRPHPGAILYLNCGPLRSVAYARATGGRDDPPSAVPAPPGPADPAVEILDPRWTRPSTRRVERDAARSRGRTGGPRREVPGPVRCQTEHLLLMHLRMTGALLFDPPPSRGTPACASSSTAGTGCLRRPAALWYRAPMPGCGRARGLPGRAHGVEPFTPEFTPSICGRWRGGRRAPVKAFLLDQRRIAGVGNIYADEALFRAGILRCARRAR